ncbi:MULTISPECIES: SDR family oxidoreductase [Rhodomicrobium]|uniref:SDR family NAD(P)-dependent oxidoreductase n=1 Tax=Rhodomicrobium TaxID=1068 RepID=UPI00148335C7|nr:MULTISPECIES: SDR family oxidoreductase [Rhodomicrobium]
MQNGARQSAKVRAVIIGGSKGIGKAVAESFLAEGASIAIGARDVARLRAVQAELSAFGEVHAEPCDVADAASVDRFMGHAADALGGIDALINCATSLSIVDDEGGWSAAYNIDLMGTVRSLKAAAPYLKQSDQASVVNFSSVSARQAFPDRLPYGAMKAAVEQYTASAAILYAEAGIRVNCLVVGSTEFPGGIWDRVRQTDFAKYDSTRKRIPLGGFARPNHIADAVLFLTSSHASWITGQCLVVDGGQTAGAPPLV